MKKSLYGYLCLMISGAGALALALLLMYGEFLHMYMPDILVKSGISRYHVEHYLTDTTFLRAYRCSLFLSCLFIFLGGALWFLQAQVVALLALLRSRLKELLAIRQVTAQESAFRLATFDRYAGVVLLGVAAVVMLIGMFTMPIRGDEAVMYDSVASSTLPVWAVAYIAPNNHVGYSSLVWLGHFFWDDSISGMRWFSFVAWLLAIVLLAQICLETFQRYSLSLIALAMTLPMMMTLAVLSRGYILGALLIYSALLMGLRGKGPWDALIAGLPGSLALWVVPSMLYGVVLISGVILWNQWADKKRALLMALTFASVAILGAMVLYLPIVLVSGLDKLIGNKWVAPIAWEEVRAQYGHWLKWRTLPVLFSGAIAPAVLVCVGIQRLAYKPQLRLIILAILPLIVFLFPLLQWTLPPPRAFAFIAPLVFIFWGGFRLQWWWHAIYSGLALTAAVVILMQGTNVVRNNIAQASDSASEAAHIIAQTPFATVQTLDYDPDYACLRFYLRRESWKDIIKVNQQPNAPFVFATTLEEVPAGYKRTSVQGLYQSASYDQEMAVNPVGKVLKHSLGYN